MAFDEMLAARVRQALSRRRGVSEKQMFGGIGFLLNGNMCCGVHGDELIVRLAPEETDSGLDQPHTRRFDLTGRPMKGWLLVKPDGVRSDAGLKKWVEIAVTFVRSLPAK